MEEIIKEFGPLVDVRLKDVFFAYFYAGAKYTPENHVPDSHIFESYRQLINKDIDQLPDQTLYTKVRTFVMPWVKYKNKQQYNDN